MAGGRGHITVEITMFGWIPAVLALFRKMAPRQAAAVSFCFAWMFLPVASFPLKGLPDYTKTTATCFGILAAAWLYDRARLMRVRPSLLDLPMVLWCTCPLLSSLSNGLGPYDGLSESMYQTVTWGLPYLVGRLYFADIEGQRILTRTVILGGLIYIPFCIVEMVMSPQLHRTLYGYHQHAFLQTIKGNGFRPMVFMEHGLMTAMWMVTASFLGIWCLACGRLPKKVRGIPTVLPIGLLVLVTCMMRSMGAVLLLLVALGCLFASRFLKTRVFLAVLLLIPPVYAAARINGWWSGDNLSRLVAEQISEERAQSLQFRMDNEDILIHKAQAGGLFGWGGWGRSRVFDEDGKDISVTDGLWIITLGTRGIYGLFWMNLAIVLPALVILFRTKPKQLFSNHRAVPAAAAMILAIYMIDNLPNAMVNPIFMLFNGALAGYLLLPEQHEVQEPETVKTKPTIRFLGTARGCRLIGGGSSETSSRRIV